MAKVVDRTHAQTGRPAFICDYSPPRSGRPEDVPAPPQSADFISAAYNPGRAVRTNSVATAVVLRDRYDADPIFTLATRDMNRLALESLLLGAQALGLEKRNRRRRRLLRPSRYRHPGRRLPSHRANLSNRQPERWFGPPGQQSPLVHGFLYRRYRRPGTRDRTGGLP